MVTVLILITYGIYTKRCHSESQCYVIGSIPLLHFQVASCKVLVSIFKVSSLDR